MFWVQRKGKQNAEFGSRFSIIIIIIIIYHDFLPTPRRGSHVKSGKTHTHSHQDTPLSPYTSQLSLDVQQLRPFYSLSQPHHVTASLSSPCENHQSMGGRSERTQCQAKMVALNSFSYICTRALHAFRSSAHCRAASTIIPLLPNATFTPSIQHNLGLPRTRPPLTSAINTLLAIR